MERRIKGVCVWMLTVISIFIAGIFSLRVANANEEASMLIPLKNKELLSIMQYSAYNDWALYQPSAREMDINTSSKEWLDGQSTYPIIAMRDDKICLVILKRINSQWSIAATNENALSRDGFILSSFSIDGTYSSVDNVQYVYFDFYDEQGEILTLNLQLSNIYPSYFSSVQNNNTHIVFHYERGITVQFDYPFLSRYSYEIHPKQYTSFNVDEFSFADCMIETQDYLVPARTSPQEQVACLYIFPDCTMEPVFKLQKGELLHVLQQQQLTDWVLVFYKGNLFFAHADDIILSDE